MVEGTPFEGAEKKREKEVKLLHAGIGVLHLYSAIV
jgi:hypothetical protein